MLLITAVPFGHSSVTAVTMKQQPPYNGHLTGQHLKCLHKAPILYLSPLQIYAYLSAASKDMKRAQHLGNYTGHRAAVKFNSGAQLLLSSVTFAIVTCAALHKSPLELSKAVHMAEKSCRQYGNGDQNE
ncbi:hypothetical protein EGR_11178 [Echinococcus granulosus]|uniref:Uncharacterized protein n=1 Tax=Echinococcus granulosus TaxID=6210 RepID=W6TYX7_ECHGR|nr:hypothetical protein EGR_11178 [Echinococcus granulosus]EUB53965.1 hypothetical protein EGR_11178 [Echinococcus granulosus]